MAHLKTVAAEDIDNMELEELKFYVCFLSQLQFNISQELKKLGLTYKIDKNANVAFEKGLQ